MTTKNIETTTKVNRPATKPHIWPRTPSLFSTFLRVCEISIDWEDGDIHALPFRGPLARAENTQNRENPTSTSTQVLFIVFRTMTYFSSHKIKHYTQTPYDMK